jgi:hypothetical protein
MQLGSCIAPYTENMDRIHGKLCSPETTQLVPVGTPPSVWHATSSAINRRVSLSQSRCIPNYLFLSLGTRQTTRMGYEVLKKIRRTE